jgi:DNA-binding NarL/FixJ family response regulator
MHLALRTMLAAMHGFVLTAAAGTVAEAQQLVLRAQPDLLISDAELAGQSGIDLCRWTRQASPRTVPVILTSRDEPRLALSALAAGASGYLLKASPAEELMTYLRQAASGQRVVDERLGTSPQASIRPDTAEEFGLSRREREVLDEVLAGLDNRAIARRLCISEDTVKSHVKAIFRKLGARDRAHAVALALGTAVPPEPRQQLGKVGRRPAEALLPRHHEDGNATASRRHAVLPAPRQPADRESVGGALIGGPSVEPRLAL